MSKTKELNLYLELLIQFLKIPNAVSIECINTLFPFSFFKPQKQLTVHLETLTLTYSWNHNLLQRKGDILASKKGNVL